MRGVSPRTPTQGVTLRTHKGVTLDPLRANPWEPYLRKMAISGWARPGQTGPVRLAPTASIYSSGPAQWDWLTIRTDCAPYHYLSLAPRAGVTVVPWLSASLVIAGPVAHSPILPSISVTPWFTGTEFPQFYSVKLFQRRKTGSVTQFLCNINTLRTKSDEIWPIFSTKSSTYEKNQIKICRITLDTIVWTPAWAT